jgi:hypothetical protein
MITKQTVEAAELARARANFTDENIEVFARLLADFIAGWASEDGDPYPPVPFNILREGLVHVFREPLTSTDWRWPP